jgi:membrane associated rhomboid family serine protease
MPVCYRHPSRETGVSCSSCGRPICPDCMTPTSVGMRCPECARQRTKVRNARTQSRRLTVTQVLIALNVIVFVAETATGAPLGGGGGGTIWSHGALFGPALTGHNPAPFYTGTDQYWRLVTAGFLHDGILHILVNMFSLYFVGMALEPGIGRMNFAFVYGASLLSGSFGALLFTPDSPTIGASGAIFGIFGALIVVARVRGISIWQSGLGFVLLVNLFLSVSVAGISLGGHLGGLVGGLICGWLVVEVGERRRMPKLALAGCVLVGILSVVGAIAVAGSRGLVPHGITI